MYLKEFKLSHYELFNIKIMFKQAFSLLQDGQILNITIFKKGDKLTVATLPDSKLVKDSVKSKLVPLSVTGTVEELETGFWSLFASHLPNAVGIISNEAHFEKALKEAQKEGSTSENKKNNNQKPVSKHQKQIDEAKRLESKGQIPEALIIYRKVYEADKTNKEIEKKVLELDAMLRQRTFNFGDNDSEKQVTVESKEENKIESSFDPMAELQKLNNDSQISKENPPKIDEPTDNQQKPIDFFAQIVEKNTVNNPTSSEKNIQPKSDEEEDEEDEHKQFLEFQRYKKMMKDAKSKAEA